MPYATKEYTEREHPPVVRLRAGRLGYHDRLEPVGETSAREAT